MGGESGLAEAAGEGVAVVHEGFAAGDNGQPARMGGGGCHQFGYR